MHAMYQNATNESSFILRDQKLVVRVYCSYHPAFILRQENPKKNNEEDNAEESKEPVDPLLRENWKADFKKVRSLLEESAFEFIDVDDIVRSTKEPGFVFTDPKTVRYKNEIPMTLEQQENYALHGLAFEVHKVDYDQANFFKIVGRTADDRSVCLLARKPAFSFYVSHHSIKSGKLTKGHLPNLEQEVNSKLVEHLKLYQPFIELDGRPVRLDIQKRLKAIDISAPKSMLRVTVSESRNRFKVSEILDGIFATTWLDLRPSKENHRRYFPKNLKHIKTFQSRFTETNHVMLDNNIYIRGWLDLAPEGDKSLRLIPPGTSRCSTADLEYEINCCDLKGHSPNPFEAPDPKWERQTPSRVLALDAEMLGVGGKFPRYEQDPVISFAAYTNTFDRANKKNYSERIRSSPAGEGASQTRSTGRCNYDDAALFCLGSLSGVRSSVFAPTYLPNIPDAPSKFDRGWNKNGLDESGAYHQDYAVSIRTWNAFLGNFRTWISQVGEYRARCITNNAELYRWLASDLLIRPSGSDPTKEWKDHSQILEWESRCAWIAQQFPLLIKKKDIGNLNTTQKWTEAMASMDSDAAEREYGTIQARWTLCRPASSVFSFETEGDMFRGFYNYIRSYDPDIITGYNSNNFDLSYFINRVRVLELLKDDKKSFISMGRMKADSDRDEIKHSFSKATGDRSFHVPRIGGRDAYDLMNYMMRDVKLDSYSLASVAKYFLKDTKNDVPYSAIPSLFRNNRERLNAYCGKDAELVMMLINETNNMNYLISLARLIGLMHTERLYVDGKQEQVFSVLMRWFRDEGAGKVMNDRNKYSKEEGIDNSSFEGAHVFPPKTLGLYMLLLLCLDYNALYPNIMRANNLGHDKSGTKARMEKYGYLLKDCFPTPRTFVNPKTGLDELYYFVQPRKLEKQDALALGLDLAKDCKTIPEKPGFWIFEDAEKKRFRCYEKDLAEKQLRKEDAVYVRATEPALYTPKLDVASICSAVTKMLEARGRVNRLKGVCTPGSVEHRRLDMVQMALKIICNSTYGATGVKVGKLAGMHISATVTSFGKSTILKLAAKMHEEFGADVQGGDTDSIFAHFPSIQTPEQIYEKIDVIDKETGEVRRMTRIAQILEVANSLVPSPMRIEFEKGFLQFCALAKKRAVALTLMPQWDSLRQENVFGKPKLDIKGLENKRRDSCVIAKDTITGYINRLFGLDEDGGDKEGRELCAAKFARKAIDRVDRMDVPMHELIQSRQLSKKHYNTQVPHMTLNEKMRRRGYRPKELGERINFIRVTGRYNRSFSDSVEDPDEVMRRGLTPDFNYIVEKKMEKPLRRFTSFMPKGAKYNRLMFENRRIKQKQNILEDDPIFSLVQRCTPCIACGNPTVKPVCGNCRPNVDWQALKAAETVKLRKEEVDYETALKICRRCTGVGEGDAIDCDNGNCPSYYPRRGGEFALEKRNATLQDLDNHLNW